MYLQTLFRSDNSGTGSDPKNKHMLSNNRSSITIVFWASISTFIIINAIAYFSDCIFTSAVYWALYFVAAIFQLFIKYGEKRVVFHSLHSLMYTAFSFEAQQQHRSSAASAAAGDKVPGASSPMFCIANADLGVLMKILPSSVSSNPVLSLLLASSLQGSYLCLVFGVTPLLLLAKARLVYSRPACALLCTVSGATLILSAMFEISLENRQLIVADKKPIIHPSAVNSVLCTLFRNDVGKGSAESPMLHAILVAITCVTMVTACAAVALQRGAGFALFLMASAAYVQASRQCLAIHVDREPSLGGSGKKNK